MFAETMVKGGHVTHGEDAGLLVEFYLHPIENTPFVRINIPGDKTTEGHFKATDHYRQRFPAQWEAFEKGYEQMSAGGTPLEHCPFLTDGARRDLHARNVYTAEALANVNDGLISQLGHGARQYVDKAKAFVAERQSSALASEKEAENAALKATLAQMQERLDALEAPRRGRPRKEDA